MQRLANKVAVITGGTGGIGLAAARLFIAEGARVVLVDVDQGALDAAVTELGTQALGVAADVADDEASAAYVAAALDHFGRLDVAFLNAGIEGAIANLPEYPLETYERVMAVNVRGVF